MDIPVHGENALLCESCGEPIKGRAVRVLYGSVKGARFTRTTRNNRQGDFFHGDTAEARRLNCGGPGFRAWGDRA